MIGYYLGLILIINLKFFMLIILNLYLKTGTKKIIIRFKLIQKFIKFNLRK